MKNETVSLIFDCRRTLTTFLDLPLLYHPISFEIEFGDWASGQAVQPVLLDKLKLSIAVYGQKLDGRTSR